jgi:hypothetical protein
MRKAKDYSLVAIKSFIESTRDSGYKSTASAVAELVDNAFEAKATKVDVRLIESRWEGARQLTVVVNDNGTGMTPSTIRLALQFGGSTRFNSRSGCGRYGMGLPNSSLSQARRVDVYSWTKSNAVWWSYLDVDEIVSGNMQSVPKSKRVRLDPAYGRLRSKHGTLIMWSKCDRLDYRKEKTLTAKLHSDLGRIFRQRLWDGKRLTINGEMVRPVDPLLFREGNNLTGALQYGPPLKYEIAVLAAVNRPKTTVTVTFVELPIDLWHGYSNEQKNSYGISKNAGVSIIRAGREIDYGWFFMGSKRKENYDDWWRCEVQFDPELDELFGVTHTKQGINPTDAILSILELDIERIARELNNRVRKKYIEVRASEMPSVGVNQASRRDYLLEPPSRVFSLEELSLYQVRLPPQPHNGKKKMYPGLEYRIAHKPLEEISFFVPLLWTNELVVLLNEEHPFYERIFSPLICLDSIDARSFRASLELLLLAAARAECSITDEHSRDWARTLRESWSNALTAFLA